MSSPPSDRGCLDEDTLQGWVKGTLTPEIKTQARAHVEDCEACFAAIAEVHAVTAVEAQEAEEGRYTLGVELGRGGMGVVYRGRDRVLSRDVAIKVLHAERSAPEQRERLLDESTAMARLRHPNVVAVHDIVVEDGQAFVVMELVEGQTLRLWFETSPRSGSEVLAMFEEIGRGLEAAHDAGVVHRDFKPENVLVGPGGRPQIVDFGIASTHVGPSAVTLSASDAESDVGTPGYMAPEQRAGGHTDARADQYAFCVSLWEMLFGARPAEDSSATRGPGLPRVRRVLARGLEGNPESRYDGMGTLLAALQRAQRSRWPGIAVLGAIAFAGSTIVVAQTNAPSAGDSCMETMHAVSSEAPSVQLMAIDEGLQLRDGFRGELLAQQARRDIAGVKSGLGQAAAEACEALGGGERGMALSCLLDIDAELDFILEGAATDDLNLLHEIHRLRTNSICMPLAVERGEDRAPNLWGRWADGSLRVQLAQAEVLARRLRPEGAEVGDTVVRAAEAWGQPRLQTRGYIASGRSVWDVDSDRARANFEAAADLAHGGDDRFLEAQVWTAWGSLAQGSWETEIVAQSLQGARRAQAQLSSERLREALEPRIALLSMLADFNAGRPELARAQLNAVRKLVQSMPDEVPTFAELEAILALLDGDTEGALQIYRVLLHWRQSNGLTSSPDLAASHVAVAELELELGRFEDAHGSVMHALELVDQVGTSLPQRQDIDCLAAREAAGRGDFEGAAARLAPHLASIGDQERDPVAGVTLKAWGRVLLLEGRYEEAVEVLTRARTISGLDVPAAIGAAIEVALPTAIAMRRAGRTADARALLTPLEAWHRERFPKILSTDRASLTMAWIDLDDDDHAAALARFAKARDQLVTPTDRAWADFGYVVASARLRGVVLPGDRALVADALARLSARASSCHFEVSAIEAWLVVHPR